MRGKDARASSFPRAPFLLISSPLSSHAPKRPVSHTNRRFYPFVSLSWHLWSIKWLSKVRQQLFYSPYRALMALNLALPPSRIGIRDQVQFQLPPLAQPWGIRRRRHKLGTVQIQLTFTRSFLGQTQAVT